MASSVSKLIDGFPANPVATGKSLQRMFLDDPRRFFVDVLPLLRKAPDAPGFYYVLALLHSQNLILKNLCDPRLFTKQESISLAKRMARVEPLFDMKLAKTLLATDAKPGSDDAHQEAQRLAGLRLLEIMTEASDRGRSLLLAQLLHHPNAQIRSKAALLVGKSTKDVKWVSQRMNEPDSRIRANALEALWGVDSEECRQIFTAALDDPANRVVGNGVLGLYRLGVPAAIESILRMIAHSDENFRKTGLWLMSESGDPRFLPALARLMRESTPALRPFVFRAFAKLKQKRSALASLPALRLHALPLRNPSDGWNEIEAVVLSPSGTFIPGLKPTQFTLWQADNLVVEYSVEAFAEKDPLSVALAMPRNVESPEVIGPQERALVHCLGLKRKGDAWMVLQYCSAEGAELPASPEDLSPELRFSTDGAVIQTEIQARRSRPFSSRTLADAIGSLIPALSRGRGRRHMILLDDGRSQVPEAGQIQPIVDSVKIAEIVIHAISPRETALLDLCLQTSGKWLRAPNEDSLPDLLSGLYTSLTSSYQLRYRIGDAPADLKVEVCTDQGAGEATLRV